MVSVEESIENNFLPSLYQQEKEEEEENNGFSLVRYMKMIPLTFYRFFQTVLTPFMLLHFHPNFPSSVWYGDGCAIVKMRFHFCMLFNSFLLKEKVYYFIL